MSQDFLQKTLRVVTVFTTWKTEGAWNFPMKRDSIVFTAPGRAELQSCEWTAPELKRDEVYLETECTLISPGTERACLLGLTDETFPKYLGYSAVAKVLRAGDEAGFQPGERVAVYHSIHSSHLVKQARDLVRIEDDALSAHTAVFSIIAAMGLQGVRRARPEFGESLAVMGLGLLGLFAVRCSYLSGLYPVIAVDFNERRRKLALEFGADVAFSPDEPDLAEKIRHLTGGHGADVVVEVTGNPDALNGALDFTAPGGRVTLTGCSRTPTHEIDFYHKVHRPGISIIGAHNMARPLHDARPGCWTMREDMALLLRLFSAGRIQPELLVDQVASPKEAPAIFERIARGDPELLGVIFDWRNFAGE